jgi:hypothetical protein
MNFEITMPVSKETRDQSVLLKSVVTEIVFFSIDEENCKVNNN